MDAQAEGTLELSEKGWGFLRSAKRNYAIHAADPFVPGDVVRRFVLRGGENLTGDPQRSNGRGGGEPSSQFTLRNIRSINGLPAEHYSQITSFNDLTAVDPRQRIQFETPGGPITMRVVDLMTPIGRGQRGLIAAPPRTGKTILLQQMAAAISANHPDIYMMVLLIDERPEEVTDMKRAVNGEVVASSLDRDVESHVRIAQLVVERCKRLVELGKDVFLLMDSITRMARAFNKWVGNTGRTMSGGVDIKALDIPKKLFATARVFEEGGSVTICATALIDTGSRMDELIFQEFKGTGNMELVLDRKLSDRRVWPAIDITQSGTRREEKLLDPETLHAVTMLRRTLSQMHHVEAMEQLTSKLAKFKSNREFIKLISGAGADD